MRIPAWTGLRFWPETQDGQQVPLRDRLGVLAAAVLVVLAALPNGERGEDVSGQRSRLAAAFAPAPPVRETMIAAYGGAPYTYPSDVKIEKAGSHNFIVRDVAWDAEPFRHPLYYGARIVQWGSGGAFGGMLDFTHAKVMARLDEEKEFQGTLRGAPAPARAVLRDIFHKLEFSHGHNILTLNGLLRLPAFAGYFSPYLGVGGGITLPHSEVQIKREPGNARTYEYQFAGAAGQALAGIEIRFARISLFIEYKFTFAPYRIPLSENDSTATLVEDVWGQFRRWAAGEPPPGGTLATDLASHHLVSGLGVRVFAAPAPAD